MGLCGVGLLRQNDRIRDALKAQDGLYTLVTRDALGDRARVIGSIVQFRYAPEDPEGVLEALASPSTRIVALTITDRGYYLNHGTGEFDDRHPDVVHDLAHPRRPVGTFGYLAEALDRLRLRGLPPFTILSCDNFQNNGDLTRKMLLSFLAPRDPALRDWVEERGAFPNSMVDRITPVTTDEHRALVRDRFGIEDAWPVTTEPFTQWVIEDHFAQGRPPWEDVGAQITGQVGRYERMKIRLLNGGHQVLCYIGLLLGHRHVHEAASDPLIRRLLQRFMDDKVTPTLPPVPGVALEAYERTLRERFANPAINDQLARIAVDSPSRIAEFLAPTISDQVVAERPIRIGSFAVASWIRYLGGIDDAGRPMTIVDPMTDRLRGRADRAGVDPRDILSIADLFDATLANNPRFIEEVGRALQGFARNGVRATLADYGNA